MATTPPVLTPEPTPEPPPCPLGGRHVWVWKYDAQIRTLVDLPTMFRGIYECACGATQDGEPHRK